MKPPPHYSMWPLPPNPADPLGWEFTNPGVDTHLRPGSVVKVVEVTKTSVVAHNPGRPDQVVTVPLSSLTRS